MLGRYIPTEYLPILVFILFSIAFAMGMLILSFFAMPRRPYAEKLMPYESGNPPVGEPRYRFSVHFYIVAMLFVVFDVEAVFLYPWAVVFGKIGLYAFVEMMIFIAILLVGYVYAWKKDAFTWE